MWTSDKTLEKIDSLSAPAICAVYWSPENIAAWKTNWNPTDIRTGRRGGSTDTVGNPVVTAALSSLTVVVNVGTGLSHPSDRASAIQMFTLLRDGGETYASDEVRAWAVRNGWDPKDARELAEVGQKILEGRRLRAGDTGVFRADSLATWRQEAAR